MDNTIQRRFASIFKTLSCFIVFLICVQPLALCYLIVSFFRWIWRAVLEVKYPDLEFVNRPNLRSLSDTSRNPGIVNVILHLEGEYNVDIIKETILNGVLQRCNKYGEFCFPKLRSNLVTCWGNYAWKPNKGLFNINNHINLYPSNYRGRPVTEANVQDYISNIVSKYLPPEQPPWQICIVPLAASQPTQSSATTTSTLRQEDTSSTTTDRADPEAIDATGIESSSTGAIQRYYIIVRMHHLLISQEPDLRLNELLQIESFVPAATEVRPADQSFYSASQIMVDALSSASASSSSSIPEIASTSNTISRDIYPSPLTNILDCPTHIPKLYFRIRIIISNLWNEFICNYDPYMENHWSRSVSTASSTSSDIDYCGDGKPKYYISTIFAVLLISCVTIITDFFKGYYATRSNPLIKIKFLTNLIKREVRKRNITWSRIGQAISASFNPIQLIKMGFAWIWWVIITVSLMWPYWAYREFIAFRCCCFMGYAGYPNTITGFLFEFTPLVYRALWELIQITIIIYQAPRCIYEELIENKHSYEHALQNISLCGRKVLSWSDKISIKAVREASLKHKCSPTELYFSVASATLAELLNEFDGVPVPKHIRTFASHVVHDYLLGKTDSSNKATGHLCIRLPIEAVSKQQIEKIQRSFVSARRNQTALYFLFVLQKRFDVLTKILPNVWTVILFNYLSRRFTVSITEISKTGVARYPQRASTVCWGHPIIDAMYFSPPQTNASMSLSVQQFGDYIQLGVMADAQIHPLHLKISDGWARNLQKLF